MAKKQQWRKKDKPWIASIACQELVFLSEPPPSFRGLVLLHPCFLMSSGPKCDARLTKPTSQLPATENVLWRMLH